MYSNIYHSKFVVGTYNAMEDGKYGKMECN